MSKTKPEKKTPYKDPVFLFTSSSLRFAAWAGWHSAFGDREKAEKMRHQAHTEWAKEIGSIRRFNFFDRYNSDMWTYISDQTMARLVNNFFKAIKEEIRKGKLAVK